MLPEKTIKIIEQDAENFRLLKIETGYSTNLDGQKRAYAIGAIAYAKKAQRLAEALESVKKDLEVIIEVYPTLAAAKVGINTIDNALQQWRGEK